MEHIIAAGVVNVILATSENWCIGVNNTLPWHLRGDLQNFKRLTNTNKVVMGRKTFESIGKPLSKRDNYVVTHDQNFSYDGVNVISLDGIANIRGCVFIIGGASIYKQVFDKYQVDYIHLTRVHTTIDGDAFMDLTPYLDDYKVVDSVSYTKDDNNDYDYDIITYEHK